VGLTFVSATDSLASVTKDRGQPLELNLFAEMQAFAPRIPTCAGRNCAHGHPPRRSRARAGGSNRELAEGLRADIIAVPFIGKAAETFDSIVAAPGEVAVSMIDGEWVIAPAALNSNSEMSRLITKQFPLLDDGAAPGAAP